MAEKIVSPGVFTKENDLSFLPQGVSQIGAAVIGPTAKGPAFIPTLVESYEDFTRTFGAPDGKSYVPYTVRNYLKHSGAATVVRVVGIAGYNSDLSMITVEPASGSLSGSEELVMILAPTSSVTTPIVITITENGSVTDTFGVVADLGSGIILSASLNPNKDNYLATMLGYSPVSTYPVYVYHDNPVKLLQISDELVGIADFSVTETPLVNELDLVIDGNSYSTPFTPWIQSQLGNDLFKVHHFNAGQSDVYISIENIKMSGEIAGTEFGSFTLLVRELGDTDLKPVVLEAYQSLNFDPTSPNYILRRIGDQYRVVEDDPDGNPKIAVYGDYPNKSKYIRIEMTTNTFGETEVPFGFKEYLIPTENEQGYSLKYRTLQKKYDSLWYETGTTGSFNFKYYSGFDQTVKDNLFVLKPVSETSLTGLLYVTGSEFSLYDISVQTGGATSAITASAVDWINASGSLPVKSRKFSVALQGGFDGIDPTVPKYVGLDIESANVFGFNCAGTDTEGSVAYRRAIDVVSNPDEFDINMLVMPGIIYSLHPSVIIYANDVAEARGDIFFLFDSSKIDASKAEAIADVNDIDSSYAGVYYPWVKIYDSENSKYMWVPSSTVMASVIAFNDKVSAPWYAPAGLNRGGIPEATQVYTRLSQADRDDLYEGRINPIVSFIGQGIVAWGQKTLQVKASALDRINVRRLLIELKKYIASATKYLVFEQNTFATRTRFLNIVNPYMDSVQQKQGLYTFKVVMDETLNTPDIIDRNMMVGKIYLQPTKVAEMIVIDFNITPTGAVFGQ